MTKITLLSCMVAVACCIVGGGCTCEEKRVEINDVREVPVEERVGIAQLATPERMGLSVPGDMPPGHVHAQGEQNLLLGNETQDPTQLRWVIPEHWREGEARAMRLATMVPEGTTATECVLSVLSGNAGGIIPNLNRWRGQIGLGPLTESETQALSKVPVLGVDAVYMACSGQVPGASESIMLMGIVCPLPEYTVFLKMTGPAKEMDGEERHFLTFAQSLHFEEAGRS